MKIDSYTNVYFSPYGGTERTAGAFRDFFVKELGENGQDIPCEKLDLLRCPPAGDKNIDSHSLMTVCVPVYAGRLPEPAAARLQNLKGNNSPAVAVVVYGNRDYDDALLELTDLLRNHGFYIVGAAAVIAEHSIFPQVAAGRPDQADMNKMAGFVSDCAAGVRTMPEELQSNAVQIKVNGNHPYKEILSVPVKPQVSKRCNNCGICGKLCPVQAINQKDCRQFDKERCISCAACIRNCPRNARSFAGPVYAAGAFMFKKKYSFRREPEFFL